MSRIVYKLNGYNLNELGIIVKSADGLIDLPELKKRKECDWADMHGKIIDTRRPYFEPRTITLDCAWPIESKGRNYIIAPTTTGATPDAARCSYTYDNDTATYVIEATNASFFPQLIVRNAIPNYADLEGKTVTMSVSDIVPSNTNTEWRIYLQATKSGETDVSRRLFQTSKKETFTFPTLGEGWNCGLILRVAQSGGSIGDTLTVSKLKLEVGESVTNWTPAPQDVNAEVPTESGTFNIQTAEKMIRENLLALGQQVRLEVHFDSKILVKPLIFNVIQDKGITFGRKFSGADVLLTFKITLIEPQPCKIVLESKKTRGSYTRTESSIGFTPNGAVFDVDWGDGSTVYDIGSGSTLPITHTYSSDGTFYVIISGDVAAITNLTKSNDFAELWTLK